MWCVVWSANERVSEHESVNERVSEYESMNERVHERESVSGHGNESVWVSGMVSGEECVDEWNVWVSECDLWRLEAGMLIRVYIPLRKW